jgi:hypothetical protein
VPGCGAAAGAESSSLLLARASPRSFFRRRVRTLGFCVRVASPHPATLGAGNRFDRRGSDEAVSVVMSTMGAAVKIDHMATVCDHANPS